MSRKKHILGLLSLSIVLTSIFFCSYSASAIDLSLSVNFLYSLNAPYFKTSNNESFHQSDFSIGTSQNYSSLNSLVFTDNDGSWGVPSGSFLTIVGYVNSPSIMITQDQNDIFSQPTAIVGFSSSASGITCSYVDFQYNLQEAASETTGFTYRYLWTYTCRVVSSQSSTVYNPKIGFYLNTAHSSSPTVATLGLQYINVWSSSDSEDSIVEKLDDIYTYLSSVQSSSLDTISQNTLNTYNRLGDILNSQQDANDDANDRYQDEKDTINDAANDAKDAAESQDFGFTIPNPLSSFFSNFSDAQCVSISVLSTWIHSNEKSICTPWPSNVRSALTTVFTGLFSLVLFRFFVSWVKGKDSSD